MTHTVLSSATREVVIGFDRPFVMVDRQRIDPTGRKSLAVEMAAGDFSTVLADAVSQVGAGAHMLDVNAGIPLADEPAILAEAVRLVRSVTDVPLCIDSSIVEALEAGLAAYEGKALVNSVTGEEERLERVLPLVAKHGAAVVGDLERRDRHLRGPGRPVRGREADRRTRGGPRHRPFRRRRRPARDAGRRDANGWATGAPPRPAPQGGARREHDLRRVEHRVRPAAPALAVGGVHLDGRGERHDIGDRERDGRGHPQGGRRCRRARWGTTRTAGRGSDASAMRRPARLPPTVEADAVAVGARRGARPWPASRERPGRGSGRLHTLRQARIVRGRHERPGRGTRPSRRPGFGLRWAGDVRPLPGRRQRGLARRSTRSNRPPIT